MDLGGGARASGRGILLERVMPDYEFESSVSTVVRASPHQVFRVLQELTVAEATPPPVRALLWLRYLPGRLTGRGESDKAEERARPLIEQAIRGGNVLLAEETDRELVIGVTGKLHNLFDQQPAPIQDAEEFASFWHPDYQKLAMSWRIGGSNESRGCTLVMKHRTHALSPGSRKKFALYWWLMIKPGSAVLSRILLRAIKRRAEAGGDTPVSTEQKEASNEYAGYLRQQLR